MVSSGADSVTHCPLLWMVDVRGAGGGRLPKASIGTWRGMSCHKGSWAVPRPCAVFGRQERRLGPTVGTEHERLEPGLGWGCSEDGIKGRSVEAGELESWLSLVVSHPSSLSFPI